MGVALLNPPHPPCLEFGTALWISRKTAGFPHKNTSPMCRRMMLEKARRAVCGISGFVAIELKIPCGNAGAISEVRKIALFQCFGDPTVPTHWRVSGPVQGFGRFYCKPHIFHLPHSKSLSIFVLYYPLLSINDKINFPLVIAYRNHWM